MEREEREALLARGQDQEAPKVPLPPQDHTFSLPHSP